jgi:methionine-rich copper-binding protein CopC
MSRTPIIAVALALLGAGVTATAWAHAFLDRAQPGVGSTLRQPPGEVRLWFSQALEPAFSRVEVVAGDGRRVDKRDGRVDATDRKLLVASLEPLGPGAYTVRWGVLSVDSHRTTGDFKFTVAP